MDRNIKYDAPTEPRRSDHDYRPNFRHPQRIPPRDYRVRDGRFEDRPHFSNNNYGRYGPPSQHQQRPRPQPYYERQHHERGGRAPLLPNPPLANSEEMMEEQLRNAGYYRTPPPNYQPPPHYQQPANHYQFRQEEEGPGPSNRPYYGNQQGPKRGDDRGRPIWADPQYWSPPHSQNPQSFMEDQRHFQEPQHPHRHQYHQWGHVQAPLQVAPATQGPPPHRHQEDAQLEYLQAPPEMAPPAQEPPPPPPQAPPAPPMPVFPPGIAAPVAQPIAEGAEGAEVEIEALEAADVKPIVRFPATGSWMANPREFATHQEWYEHRRKQLKKTEEYLDRKAPKYGAPHGAASVLNVAQGPGQMAQPEPVVAAPREPEPKPEQRQVKQEPPTRSDEEFAALMAKFDAQEAAAAAQDPAPVSPAPAPVAPVAPAPVPVAPVAPVAPGAQVDAIQAVAAPAAQAAVVTPAPAPPAPLVPAVPARRVTRARLPCSPMPPARSSQRQAKTNARQMIEQVALLEKKVPREKSGRTRKYNKKK